MGLKSNIEWTDVTWNPWQGCTKVSPACEHCYMFRDFQRFGKEPTVVVRSERPTFGLPLKRRRSGEFAIPAGSKVFACSYSDWFHAAADGWRDEAWSIIRQRRDVIFQLVTKRVERIPQCLPSDWGEGYSNVWLIATAENQEWLDRRAELLAKIPAVMRGFSLEPLLGPVDLSPWLALRQCDSCMCPDPHCPLVDDGRIFHQAIVGGETGPGARPLHPQWARDVRDQCQAAGAAFFFKQWGEFIRRDLWQRPADGLRFKHVHGGDDAGKEDDPFVYLQVGKKKAGRLLDGREWSEFPRTAVEVAHG